MRPGLLLSKSGPLARSIRAILPPKLRPIGYLTNLTRERTGSRVLSGPFAEMRYASRAVGSAYLPKLLGTYERELACFVERICARRPSHIIDIGSAEGYYAIGFALRNPGARVVAFEMDEEGRRLLREMAQLNAVESRVEIRGLCEPQDLGSALDDTVEPVIVCDVEGDEERLLDPARIPLLRSACILVEMHDFIRDGLSSEIERRFHETHNIQRIWQESRSRREFPWRTIGTAMIPGSYLDWAVSEWRPTRMSWLWMEPK